MGNANKPPRQLLTAGGAVSKKAWSIPTRSLQAVNGEARLTEVGWRSTFAGDRNCGRPDAQFKASDLLRNPSRLKHSIGSGRGSNCFYPHASRQTCVHRQLRSRHSDGSHPQLNAATNNRARRNLQRRCRAKRQATAVNRCCRNRAANRSSQHK